MFPLRKKRQKHVQLMIMRETFQTAKIHLESSNTFSKTRNIPTNFNLPYLKLKEKMSNLSQTQTEK